MMVIDNKYEIGETVYLVTDKEQLQRMVTGICQKNGYILYELSQGTGSCWASDIEISKEVNILTKTDN